MLTIGTAFRNCDVKLLTRYYLLYFWPAHLTAGTRCVIQTKWYTVGIGNALLAEGSTQTVW